MRDLKYYKEMGAPISIKDLSHESRSILAGPISEDVVRRLEELEVWDILYSFLLDSWELEKIPPDLVCEVGHRLCLLWDETSAKNTGIFLSLSVLLDLDEAFELLSIRHREIKDPTIKAEVEEVIGDVFGNN